MILTTIFVLVLIGCSNEKEAAKVSEDKSVPTTVTTTTKIDKGILQDTKIISDILQGAMDHLVLYGEEDKEFEDNIEFFFDKEHYFGLEANKDKYTPEEYALLDQSYKIYRNYLEYSRSVLVDDDVAQEQTLRSFNRTMDTINTTLNKME